MFERHALDAGRERVVSVAADHDDLVARVAEVDQHLDLRELVRLGRRRRAESAGAQIEDQPLGRAGGRACARETVDLDLGDVARREARAALRRRAEPELAVDDLQRRLTAGRDRSATAVCAPGAGAGPHGVSTGGGGGGGGGGEVEVEAAAVEVEAAEVEVVEAAGRRR